MIEQLDASFKKIPTIRLLRALQLSSHLSELKRLDENYYFNVLQGQTFCDSYIFTFRQMLLQ